MTKGFTYKVIEPVKEYQQINFRCNQAWKRYIFTLKTAEGGTV